MANEEQRLTAAPQAMILILQSKDRNNNRHLSEWRLLFSLRSSDFLVRRTVNVTVNGPT